MSLLRLAVLISLCGVALGAAGDSCGCGCTKISDTPSNGNWVGEISVTVPYDVSGWSLVFEFSQSVGWVNVQDNTGGGYSVLSSNSGKIWNPTENTDNAKSAGETIYLKFLTWSDAASAQITDIYFEWDTATSLCDGNGSSGNGSDDDDSDDDSDDEDTDTGTPQDGDDITGTGNSTSIDYNEALKLSILFYEAQRSGKLPSDNRISWRGDSAEDDEVSGGYYDAGDNVKFNFPMAWSLTQLAWGGITFQAGYEAAGQLDYFTEALTWGTDYLIGCYQSESKVFVQFGNGGADHSNWEKPEAGIPSSRPAYYVSSSSGGSDVTGEMAAALAAASIYYKNIELTSKADEALEYAEKLFTFAESYKKKYSDSVSDAGSFYPSSGYEDELAWAAIWLYKATGDASYLSKARNYASSSVPSELGWDDKRAGVQIMLYCETGEYQSNVESFINKIIDQTTRSDEGLVRISSWGVLRHAANAAHALVQAAECGLEADRSREFAEEQISYMLGDNNAGYSYQIGYGDNYPLQPHHRGASCPSIPCGWDYYYSSSANPNILEGALVGGPDSSDNYDDDRTNYQLSEVATDYNAGFQSVVAALAAKYA